MSYAEGRMLVLGLLKLREGVTPEEYENWLRTVDWPVATTLPSVAGMQVYRVERTGRGPAALKYDSSRSPAQYIEILDMTSKEQLEEDLRRPEMLEIFEGFKRLIADPIFVELSKIV